MIDLKQSAVLPSSARLIRRTSIHHYLWQVFACFLILALPATGQDAVSQIKAEANRLQQSLKDKPVSIPGFPNASSVLGGSLKSAEEALDAGWLYLGLEQLDQVTAALQGAWTAAAKAEAAKSGFPGFETEWRKVSLDVAALDQKAQERDWADAQAAIRALSGTAQGKAVPLLESGRGFATALGPEEGLTFLGQAQGEAEFAKFCASLNLPRKGAPYSFRSMLPELQGLQGKTNAAFQPPRSIELHPTFINLNSALKLAQDLDTERFYAGALYQYLEAVRQYGLLDAPAPDTARQSELNRAIARMQKELDASGATTPSPRSSSSAPNHRSGMPMVPRRARTSGEARRSSSTRCCLPISPQRSRPQPYNERPARRLILHWYVGPTLETCPTQQVCWSRKLQLSSRVESHLSVKTLALPSWPTSTG